MTNKYLKQVPVLIAMIYIIVAASSCKKDAATPTPVPPPVPLTTLGLYQYQFSGTTSKRIFIPITQLGTQSVNYLSVFDTGSTGMTIDANGILPPADITSTGIVITGDSLVYNGITVTKTLGIMAYGDNLSSITEYGNLAYATVTMGDDYGKITTTRMPFFLYYKVVDQNGKVYSAHSNDVFGVGPGFSYASSLITSPLNFFNYPSGVTPGFKLGTLSANYFNSTLPYVTNLLTIGLVPNDLTSNGFIMHPENYYSFGGYSANISSTITYNGTTVNNSPVLFDTGTPSVAVIEDKNAVAGIGNLPANSLVTITTNQGFKYQYYTASTANLTEVQNPNNTGDNRTVFAIDFFIYNEYLTDYKHNQIGLKNN